MFNEFDEFEGSDEEELGSQLCPVGGRADHALGTTIFILTLQFQKQFRNKTFLSLFFASIFQ